MTSPAWWVWFILRRARAPCCLPGVPRRQRWCTSKREPWSPTLSSCSIPGWGPEARRSAQLPPSSPWPVRNLPPGTGWGANPPSKIQQTCKQTVLLLCPPNPKDFPETRPQVEGVGVGDAEPHSPWPEAGISSPSSAPFSPVPHPQGPVRHRAESSSYST